jgi:predicted GH43/DUF377 family glycosyl hydrolase
MCRGWARVVAAAVCLLSWRVAAAGKAEEGMTAIEFEEALAAMRREHYRHPKVDIIKEGFRPVGGKVADFAVAERAGRYHFFYIERRLVEGTPFYPGHETYFGHASTANFVDWEVHEPVLMVRPGTWEGAHVWAPCIVRRGDEYVMAYTGVNKVISQDIGIASSLDLFEWKRWASNPVSPCKGAGWAYWRTDGIASCRDPSLCAWDGRYWMIYTANTKEGASCIALASTEDFVRWRDHGPICVGPARGYEARLEGGHPQGSLESANLVRRGGRWFLLVKAKVRDSTTRSWIIESDRVDAFDFGKRRAFWPGAFGIEVVKDRGSQSLLATFCDGRIRFGVTDWSVGEPVGRFVESEEALKEWR